MSDASYRPPDISLIGPEHVHRYQETDGEVGYLWNGAPILLLTTTGRTSGAATDHGADPRPRRRRLPGRGLHGRGTDAPELVPEPGA